MLIPGVRTFFALDPPPLLVWLAAIGIAAIVFSLARLFVPGGGPSGIAEDPVERDIESSGA
jgi:hypothetical protein